MFIFLHFYTMLHVNMFRHLHVYTLHLYMSTCLDIYMSTWCYTLTRLHVYIFTRLHFYVFTDLHVYTFTCLHVSQRVGSLLLLKTLFISLSEPEFVSSFSIPDTHSPDDDKVYFFFRERAAEAGQWDRRVHSRVARVCKVGNDHGAEGNAAQQLSIIRAQIANFIQTDQTKGQKPSLETFVSSSHLLTQRGRSLETSVVPSCFSVWCFVPQSIDTTNSCLTVKFLGSVLE